MPIVSSAYTIDSHAQKSGARWAVAHFFDDVLGQFDEGPFLTADKEDVQARVDLRAQAINEERAARAVVASEAKAAQAKVAVVLDAAVQAGTLTEEELKRAGLSKIAEAMAAEDEVVK